MTLGFDMRRARIPRTHRVSQWERRRVNRSQKLGVRLDAGSNEHKNGIKHELERHIY
jgi:hypothetical protein